MHSTSEVRKATGNSWWLSGAKGQLTGFRSHKGLHENQCNLDRNAGEPGNRVERAKSAGTAESIKRDQRRRFTALSHSTGPAVDDGKDLHANRGPLKASMRAKSATAAEPKRNTVVKMPTETSEGVTRTKPGVGLAGRELGTVKTAWQASGNRSHHNHHRRALSSQCEREIRRKVDLNLSSSRPTGQSPSGNKQTSQRDGSIFFDLSDEKNPSQLSPSQTQPNTDVKASSRPIRSLEADSNSDRIKLLKARVIAKASVDLNPDTKKPIKRISVRTLDAADVRNQTITSSVTKDPPGKTLCHSKTGEKNHGILEVDPSKMKKKESDCGSQLENSDEVTDAFRQYNLSSLKEGGTLLEMGITSTETLTNIPPIVEHFKKVETSSSQPIESGVESSYQSYDKNLLTSVDSKRTPYCSNDLPVPLNISHGQSQDEVKLIDEAIPRKQQNFAGREDSIPQAAAVRRNDTAGKKLGKDRTDPKTRPKTASADVISRTLTSGVESAMMKLRRRQQQEIVEEKCLDRLRRVKVAERDKMASQHAKRLQQRQQQQQRQEEIQSGDGEGGGVGAATADDTAWGTEEGSSPEMAGSWQSQVGDGIASLTVQGGSLLPEATSSGPNKSDVPQRRVTKTSKATRSPDLKMNSERFQDVTSDTAHVESLQRQLSSLRRDLADATIGAPSTSLRHEKRHQTTASDGQRPSKAAAAPAPARGTYSSMSKTDLMKEVRKQKEQHKKQIRLLESELNRLKHCDPVRNCELPEGDLLYREEDKIGEGTFSRVFSGYFNGSEVAIKRLKIPLAAADRNYFAEEVGILHELRHPRVVLLIGVCTAGQLPLMVLEYMAGGSLYARIHDETKDSLDHIVYYQIARDIALGMNYLHRHRPQVIHLDLKSLNVLLGPHGRAKIADFGFAKLRHEAMTLQKSKAPGTPAWMAPELMGTSASSLTDKVDVYSFAIILWELLTGLHPYFGLSVFQVLERVQQKKRPEVPASCPTPLRNLISACWDHAPTKRPSFKNILISLEALALPPDWRSMLSAARIPRKAMEDPTSARSIIALVNDSVQMTQRELDEVALEVHTRAVHDANSRDDRSTEVSLDSSGTCSLSESDSLENATAPNIKNSKSSQLVDLSGRDMPPPPPPLDLASHPSSRLQTSLCTDGTRRNSDRHSNAPETVAEVRCVRLDSGRLVAQRNKLKSTRFGCHPSQLPSLDAIGAERLNSIAEILRKAVSARRDALREDVQSLEQPNSGSLWSDASDVH